MKKLLITLCLLIPTKTISAETGKASFYADKFHGRKTASGKTFSNHEYTAAHKSLPFGTKLLVTNLRNGFQTIVTVTDRGPFVPGRILDLSKRAAKDLNFINKGTTVVRIQTIE